MGEHVRRLDASTEPQLPAGLSLPSLNAATKGTSTVHEILQEIADVLNEQLHVREGQWINAVAAFVVGLLVLIDGDSIFKMLLVLAIFAVSAIFAAKEIIIIWSLPGGWKNDLVQMVSLEVGAIMAYVAYKGIDGIMMGIAICFGLFVASGIQQTVALQSNANGLSGNHHFTFYLYSAAVLASMAVVRKGRYFYGIQDDRVLGRALWAVIAEVGILTQMQRMQRRGYKMVAAREVQDALREPLL